MIIVEQINNSYISYDSNYSPSVREYYFYCVGLFKKKLTKVPHHSINIIFGNYRYDFNNDNKTIKVDIQFEHTIIRDGSNYLVRINDLEYLKSIDHVLEYSILNMVHIKNNMNFTDYLDHTIYISPTIYDCNFHQEKEIDLLSTFQWIGNCRRSQLLIDFKKNNIDVINVNNQYGDNSISKFYEKSKILINVHQTPHHLTLEELRIVPALLCGCVIVSEYSPFIENLPYKDYIVWSEYENIIDTVKNVYENYDTYFNKFFGGKKLENILSKMKNDNIEKIDNILI